MKIRKSIFPYVVEYSQLHILISQMFSLSGIVKEEERFDPLANDPQLNIDCFNHCLTNFYDHDSDPLIQTRCSVQEVICYLEHFHDIRDTPLSNILMSVTSNPAFKGVDLELVRRKVLKLKNKLKRERAKDRKKDVIHDISQTFRIPIGEEEEELKKQKNRLSAQLSRDRKKEKVKALEQLNRQLQEECQLNKQENERLKKQANKAKQSHMGSPFTRMILFLGIFFLFTVVKDVLSSSESAKAITKMQQKTVQLFPPANFFPTTFLTQKQALETIEEGLFEGIGEKSIAQKVTEGVKLKISEWWGKFPITMGPIGGQVHYQNVAID